jgi:hypothetical protein
MPIPLVHVADISHSRSDNSELARSKKLVDETQNQLSKLQAKVTSNNLNHAINEVESLRMAGG